MIKKQPGCSWASRQTMRWGPAFEGSHESDVCDVAQPRLRVVAASGSSHWACWVLGSLRPCLCFSFSSGDRWTSSSPSEWPQHKGRKLVCTIASDCKCLLNLIWCHRHQHPEKSVSSFGAQESSHISTSKTQFKKSDHEDPNGSHVKLQILGIEPIGPIDHEIPILALCIPLLVAFKPHVVREKAFLRSRRSPLLSGRGSGSRFVYWTHVFFVVFIKV